MNAKSIVKIVEFVEKHGLVNRIIDKLLTPEMAGAIAEGFARGCVKEMKNDIPKS